MPNFAIDKNLNENNIQAPFQYKPSDDVFILKNITGEVVLNENDSQVSVIDGEKIFAVDLGYSVDGELYEMNFTVDKIKVFPVPLQAIPELRAQEIKENSIYFVKDVNFKSIAFLSIANLNKTLSFEITSYASVFSSYMFDEVAKKINSLDTNYPVKNFYPNTDYRAGDIIKKDGYLYQVVKDFTSNDKISNSIIITPFIRKENSTLDMYSLLQDSNKFFIVNSKNGDIKPLTSIIIWDDKITEIYKDMIIIKKDKDGNIEKKYIVLQDVFKPKLDDLIANNKIVELYTAKDILYNSDEADNLQDALDLAFTKIETETEERLNKDAELEKELYTKQKTLEAGDNIEINEANDKANIKVAIHNKYDLTYKNPVFPKIAYEIPDEILFSLKLVDAESGQTPNVDNVDAKDEQSSNIEASIKQVEKVYTFNTKITLAEAKESITLNIIEKNAVELSQFFIPNNQYELENCFLTFDNNAMTLSLMPKPTEEGEAGTFEAGDLTLEYIFKTIYNKNIYFITKDNAYITLRQDETAGEPKGTVVKFEKSFEVAIPETEESTENEEQEEPTEDKEPEDTGVKFIELGILNEVIAQYFNTIDDFNIDNFVETDGIHFIRTTQEGDADPIIATEKANFGMILENNIYRFGICRRDKGKILNKDEVVISLTPDLNAELETKATKVSNLDNTIQALTEKISDTKQELQTNIDNEKTEREQADTNIQNNINTEKNERTTKDTELENEINQIETDLQNKINDKLDKSFIQSSPEGTEWNGMVLLSEAEYQQLSDEEKAKAILYFVY